MAKREHSHWRHTLVCIVLCLALHFALDWIRNDNMSKYIADQQEQVDHLRQRLDAAGIPDIEWPPTMGVAR